VQHDVGQRLRHGQRDVGRAVLGEALLAGVSRDVAPYGGDVIGGGRGIPPARSGGHARRVTPTGPLQTNAAADPLTSPPGRTMF
jgi:hypothetical protein